MGDEGFSTPAETLWLLRQGQRIVDVVRVIGVNYRTVQDWIAWWWCGAAPLPTWDAASCPVEHPADFLAPYAPELDPAERVFEAIRQEIEGIVYPSLQDLMPLFFC